MTCWSKTNGNILTWNASSVETCSVFVAEPIVCAHVRVLVRFLVCVNVLTPWEQISSGNKWHYFKIVVILKLLRSKKLFTPANVKRCENAGKIFLSSVEMLVVNPGPLTNQVDVRWHHIKKYVMLIARQTCSQLTEQFFQILWWSFWSSGGVSPSPVWASGSSSWTDVSLLCIYLFIKTVV